MAAENRKQGTPLARLASRRKFLADTGKTVAGVGIFGLALGLYSSKTDALPATALRPPGALPEPDFLAACVRCGLCVQDCPYGILKLAELGNDVSTGTPYFTARTGPCEMCEDIPCVPVCPTGALDPKMTDITKSRMGLAVVVDQESCIAFQGLRGVFQHLSGARQGDHPRIFGEQALGPPRAVRADRLFGRLHRLRPLREGLHPRGGGDQGAADAARQG